MREINYIIIHCSATRADQSYPFEACRRDHIANRGWSDIGYHYYITRDGEVHRGRKRSEVGAHCKGYNADSIGVCYEGGLQKSGNDVVPADTRTDRQRQALIDLVLRLLRLYPDAKVLGHHELNENKICPCIDMNLFRRELSDYFPDTVPSEN